MKNFLLIFLFFVTNQAIAQIWIEDFFTYSNGDRGTANGTGQDNNLPAGDDWSAAYSGANTFSVQSRQFEGTRTTSEGVWTSETIDISAYNYVEVSIDISWNLLVGIFTSSPDYIRVYFDLDGAGDVLMFEQSSEGFFELAGGGTSLSRVLEGNSVKITIKVLNDNTFFGFGTNETFTFDNIVVREATALYAIVDGGNWSTNSTWSLDDYSGPQTAFTGTVDGSQAMIIGDGGSNNFDINFDANATVRYLEVKGGSSLSWSGGDHTMTLSQPGSIVIQNGGNVSDGTNIGEITFSGTATDNVIEVNDGTTGLDVARLNVTQELILMISGTGIISFTDYISIGGNDSQLIYDGTGSATLSTDWINIVADDMVFTNNGTINLSGSVGDLIFGNDNSVFENYGTFTCSSISIGAGNNDGNEFHNNSGGVAAFIGFDLGDAGDAFTFNNSGTFTQSGGFLNAGTGFNASNFYNLTGGVWNFASSTIGDMDIILHCDATDNTFVYSGSGNQQVITPDDNYYDLTIQGGGTKTLQANVDISGQLTLSSGIIDVNGNVFNFMDNSDPVSGGSNTSYIAGPVTKTGNDAFTFPTGDNNIIAQIGFTPSGADVNTTFTAQYYSASATDPTNVTAPLTNVSLLEYWDLTPTGTLTSATVTLYYNDANRSEIETPADLRVAHYYNPSTLSWYSEGGTGTGLPAGSITSGSITTFSPFTFGSIDANNNPLPIELLSFNAKAKVNHIELNWITATEINNDFFTVERSTNAKEWEVIATVDGAGNSSEELRYQHQDFGPIPGISYYRLRQTDYDGQFEVFSPVLVVYEPAQQLTLFPNPTSDFVQINSSIDLKSSTIVLRDMNGRTIYSAKDLEGFSTQIVTDQLPDGIYMVEVAYETGTISKKLAIKR